MTLSTTTVDALEQSAVNLSMTSTPSSILDSALASLIAEPMLVIDGHTLITARYTLNVTNALQLRAKKWYMRSLMEIGLTGQPAVGCAFEYMPQPGFVQGGTNADGATLGLTTCAVICRVWAEVVRRYLQGNYP